MALSVPSFLFHDELSVGSGIDSAYVLQEKHDVVVEKHQTRGAADSTIHFFPFSQARSSEVSVEFSPLTVSNDAAGEALAAALGLGGACCSYVHCDVSEEADVERAVGCCVERYGRLDVLCNNAGVLGRQDPPAANGCTKSGGIASLDAAEFDRVLRVNTLGAALGMKHAARAMLQRRGGGGGGSIVSVASVAGVMGGMGPHAYTASKHALVGLTKNAACELGEHGIRVNCVSPFGVATPMLVNAWRHRSHDDDEEADGIAPAPPSEQEVEKTEEMVRGLATLKGATLRAGDIAEAALFLASDESRYISGHNLVVDGGVTTSRNVIGL
ncbi:sex determination protein tasselseed-2-like [Lolium rigidum]|uniref:sex determination protein tasselseed-2-like n=1 Tax=Lolium rigidum TaxID=89674 RepID=UPI001F5CD314|nr:sex determination protein tasselseed-2-like [Lolium rigidum]